MSSDAVPVSDPARLTLEDLLAVKPTHLRGKLGRGARGPDGERPGRGRAHSLDFDGLSPYAPGDDVRWIDWRASLRSHETMSRRYAAASHRARMVVLDLSPELHFGTSGQVMSKTAALTAGWLAWSALALNEPVGLMTMGQTVRPRRGRRHVLRLLDAMVNAFNASKDGNRVQPDFEAASALLSRNDEICLIAELPVPVEPLIGVGRALSAARELRLLVVEDPMMRRPLASGSYPVRGPDGVRRVVQIRDGRDASQRDESALVDAGWRIERALDLLPRRAS